eukprot:2431499-Rhodomonas_salina.2
MPSMLEAKPRLVRLPPTPILWVACRGGDISGGDEEVGRGEGGRKTCLTVLVQAYGFWGSCFNLYQDTTPHEGYAIVKKWCDSKDSWH